ncbi:uncharacterized protein LOC129919160 [Episyrphus balteatus]|uniref:uncharacterized protein LOC129919160 n=1 Tax=Episyrphus balteatus TaxID=286459 RepID=UPI0024850E77|nr:uncharacterized protein LOC129919160 [Episyrphus balteatus]
MELKILQINLHHSKAATANLVYLMESRQYDVALIQEPWVVRGNIKGLHSKELLLYKSNLDSQNSNPRTCIVAKKQFNLFLLTTYSNIDQTTVKLERDGLPMFILSSTYMPYDSTEGPPADITETLVSFATNRGNTPTFVTKTREEVLDITLTSNSDTCQLEQCKVLDEISFSDHRLIEFYVPDAAQHNKPFRNNRRTDWHVFNREIVKNISHFNIDNNLNTNGLDKLTEEFTGILRDALDKRCPLITAAKKNNEPPCWTVELTNIRKETRKLFNLAKRTRAESDWESYKTSQRKFKTETQRAKRSSWRYFCSTIECTNHSARLRRILSKTNTSIGSLKGLIIDGQNPVKTV